MRLSEPSIDLAKQAQLSELIRKVTGSCVNVFNPFKLLDLLARIEAEESHGNIKIQHKQLLKIMVELNVKQVDLSNLLACLQDEKTMRL